jgi:hypothetical protein
MRLFMIQIGMWWGWGFSITRLSRVRIRIARVATSDDIENKIVLESVQDIV